MATEQSDQLCMENIDEFVHDENKIVTCKWLSLTLKIHINQAKRLLYSFLQQQRNKKDREINATYFVAGLTQGSDGTLEHTCVVVPEEDLEATRSQMTVVTSCHVYSIQRSQLKDSNALYMTDYDGIKENLSECSKYSSIHCKRAAVPRKVTRPVDTPAKEKSRDVTTEEKLQNGRAGDATQNGSTLNVSKPKKAEPKGSIASMFASSAKKADGDGSKAKQETSAPTKKDDKKGAKVGAKKGGVIDFFANAKPAVKNKVEEKKSSQSQEKEEPPKEKTSSNTNARGKKDAKPQESNSKKKGRPTDDSDDDGPQKKRRRRIKNDLFDSSSEDEEMEIEIEESPVPSPVKEPSPEPESPIPEKETEKEEENDSGKVKPANGSTGRRRRRKLVPKTYLDEEGFMVTEKVWESESTDASEVEEDPKKKAAPEKQPAPAPTKKASPQKKASPVKGKQTSLMSFFQKK